MALLSTLLNLGSCGADGVLGTGTHGCKPFFKKTYSLWLTPAGFEYDGTETWDTTYINTLINAGTLIVVRGISQPENQSTDNTLTDIGGGVEILEDEGLYKFKYDFVKGLYWNSILASLTGYGQYDVAFVDTQGNIFGTVGATEGNWKGFTTAQISHNPMAFGDTQTGRESIVIQYPERSEIDTDFVFIQKTAVFNPKQIDGINEVKLAYANAPADTDTTVTVTAVRKQDNNAFTGADYNDFGVVVDSTNNVLTSGDDSAVTGTYVLTLTTALSSAESVVTQLGTTAVPGVAVGTRNYKSNVITAIVP